MIYVPKPNLRTGEPEPSLSYQSAAAARSFCCSLTDKLKRREGERETHVCVIRARATFPLGHRTAASLAQNRRGQTTEGGEIYISSVIYYAFPSSNMPKIGWTVIRACMANLLDSR